MTSRGLLLGLALVLGTLACEDAAGDGQGGSGGSVSAGGGEGGGTVTVPIPGELAPEPVKPPGAICTAACGCDPTCTADQDAFVAACVDSFADDARDAQLAGCTAENDAYVACFSREWTCDDTDACDDVAEALATCFSTLCEQAGSLCGCPGCFGECRAAYDRCSAVCVIQAGGCDGTDAYYRCTDACWQDEYGGSSVSGSGVGGGF